MKPLYIAAPDGIGIAAAADASCEHVWKVTSQRTQGLWSKCEKCGITKESTWD
jgi:hypothetical protein